MSIKEKISEFKRLINTKLIFLKKGLTKVKNSIIIARRPKMLDAFWMKLIR